MSTNVNTTTKELHALRLEVHRLAKKIEQKTTQGYENIIHINGKRLREMASIAGDNMRATLAEGTKHAVEMRAAAEKTIRKNPWEAISAAVASGVLIGFLFHLKGKKPAAKRSWFR